MHPFFMLLFNELDKKRSFQKQIDFKSLKLFIKYMLPAYANAPGNTDLISVITECQNCLEAVWLKNVQAKSS
jgi:hypothetical protein